MVKNRWKFMLIPALIIVVGLITLVIRGGFNYDIEFMGGIRMQVAIGQQFNNDEMADLIEEKCGIKATVQNSGDGTEAVIKTPPVEEAKKNEIFNVLKEKYSLNDEALKSVSSASASFGQEIQRKALVYTLIAIICILIYIAFRFEWRSAIMAILALVINVLVMASVYAIAYIPLNTTFIAAMLTVVGYSINNTIVIFDRVRENVKFAKGKKSYDICELVDRSIKESVGRTVNSTITTLITIVLLYIIGVSSIKEFALPLIIGIAAGAYSSILIAAPFWGAWKQSEKEAKAQNAAAARKKK